jgi:SAM-dependent methyltransferase
MVLGYGGTSLTRQRGRVEIGRTVAGRFRANPILGSNPQETRRDTRLSNAPRHAPATARNREAILAVLQRVLPKEGLLLEIASGTGEHAAFMTPRLPAGWSWQPTDANPNALSDIDAHAQASGCARIRPALLLDVCDAAGWRDKPDAILCCNMIHIAPWRAAEDLFALAPRVLPESGALILYGPFKRHGAHTAPSNAAFDETLRQQNWNWGVRCLDSDVAPLAEKSGFALDEIAPMPANNLAVVWRRI